MTTALRALTTEVSEALDEGRMRGDVRSTVRELGARTRGEKSRAQSASRKEREASLGADGRMLRKAISSLGEYLLNSESFGKETGWEAGIRADGVDPETKTFEQPLAFMKHVNFAGERAEPEGVVDWIAKRVTGWKRAGKDSLRKRGVEITIYPRYDHALGLRAKLYENGEGKPSTAK